MTTLAPSVAPRTAASSPKPNLTETVLRLLAENDIPAESIRLAHRTIAAGQAYTYATQAARSGAGDKEMTAFFECLDTVVEHIVDGRPMQPLLAAAEQIAQENAAAELGHYPWCQPGACVTAHYDDGEPYVEHHGATAVLPVPSGMPVDDDYLLRARLYADEALVDEGPYLSYTSAGNGLPLTAAEVDEAIDSLATFVEKLRTMRRQMNQRRRP